MNESPDPQQPVTPYIGSNGATPPKVKRLKLGNSWRNPFMAIFVLIFAGVGAYLIFNSFASTVAGSKTWSTTADWNAGTLSNVAVANNSVGLASSTSISNVSTTPTTTNLALNKPVTASSTSSGNLNGKWVNLPASYAVDGNTATRWSSAYSDPQWIYVDLGATYNINEVKLSWEAAYGKSFEIQVSNDATTWTRIAGTSTGTGGVNDFTGLSGTGRYVRMYGSLRGTQYGYSLWEMGVYGTPVTTASTNLALNKPATASSSSYTSGTTGTYLPPSNAFDGNLTTRWSSAYTDSEWIYVDLGATYNISEVKLNWEAAYAQAYQIQVSNDATTWTTIYSTTTGTGGVNDLTGLSGSGRYVRMLGVTRAAVNGTKYGYSLYEMSVYGPAGAVATSTAPSYDSSGSITLSYDAGSSAGSVGWTSLAPQVTLPTGTNITYQARTSSDNSTWSAWTTVTTNLSGLASSRYIQIMATLSTTDPTVTPLLNTLTLGYNATVATPTVSLSANPASVTAGQAATLTWSSANTTGCTASGAWSGSQATSGSTTTAALSQTGTDTYSLACSGAGGTANASSTVTVAAPTTTTTSSSTCGNSPSTITPAGGMAAITNYTNPVKDYEFNGSSLPSDWSTGIYNYGNIATQDETSQVKFNGSAAELVAQKTGTNGASTSSDGLPYVSGLITTAGKYSINSGRIDFCAEMPSGMGLWSGLWLDAGSQVFSNGAYTNPASTYGEIDVQEMLLGNTTTVYGSAHNWTSGNVQIGAETQTGTLTSSAATGFHDYSLVWQSGLMTWAIDGQAYAQYSESNDSSIGGWPFQNEYLVADLVVGGCDSSGNNCSWGGVPDTNTANALASTKPPMLQVKWIKVWQ